jgi:glycosyltransferase involved in cell wall biosynthesis
MRALDLLVVNSRTEPFGLTVIEAMASGVPVLATAVDGIKEIVRHGETGWLVKARNHDSLVKGMLTLLRDQSLREQLGGHGRREAIARFSIKRFVGEVEQLYDVAQIGNLRTEPQVNNLRYKSRPRANKTELNSTAE